MHLNGDGQDRLIHPVDESQLADRQIALSLKNGQQDEDNWIPKGFADRLANRYDNPLMEPPQFHRQMDVGADTGTHEVGDAIRSYAGALMADGHAPADIVADLHSASRKQGLPEHLREAYDHALREIAPLREVDTDAKGKPIQAVDKSTGKPVYDALGKPVYRDRMRKPAAIKADLEKCLHGFLEKDGTANQTLEGQTVDGDANFHEAMHRTLADDPRASAAFSPVGELTGEQQGHLRDYFYRSFFSGAKTPEEAKAAKFHAAGEALGPEPPKDNPDTLGTQMSLLDLLGDEDAGEAASAAVNPAWIDWNNAKLKLEAEHQDTLDAPSPWAQYVQRLGGLKYAQEAIQDEMRGKFSERFHEHYKHITGKVLQLDTREQASADAHLKATLGGEAAEELEKARKSKQAKLQKQGGAQFKEGKVGDALKDAGQAQALAQAEGGSLFGLDELQGEENQVAEGEPAQPWQKPELQQGHRYSLGRSLEAQITQAMPGHAPAFGGRRDPVKVREGMHMSGAYVQQQRCVKSILQLKRMGLFQGAGSGKTSIMLGALSQLHGTGKLKGKAILAVPSIVQGQFGAEAVQFLDPTSGFNVHAQPGEAWEQRLHAYQDPDQHAVVVTHQTLRDDSLRVLGEHLGQTPEEASKWLMGQSAAGAAAAMKEAWAAKGVDLQALMCDEAHGALDRDGKPDSVFSRVLGCHSHNAEYSVMATGDPMKNDVSEVWSDLNKIDPHKWHEGTKDEFMRRYGQHAELAKRSMAQELTRYWFNGRVKLDTQAFKSSPAIPLTSKQQARVAEVEHAAAKLRIGQGDPVEHAKVLAPDQFAGKAAEDHAEIAKRVQKAVGTFREAAMNRCINLDPEGGKIAHHVQVAKDRVAEGKPVVVFARNLEAVAQIHKAMEAAGLKAVSLTGKDSSKDKASKAQTFTSGHADVIVMSDAGATGVNLQHGKTLIQHDTPNTAMIHNQRTARIHRLGQTNDVEVISAVADHPWERQAVERMKTKDSLGGLFQAPDGYLDDSGLAQTLKEVRARRAQAQGVAA
ncbi:MAG TPA: DEAD/DEAH box helicase [Holophaga sp.]|nr:DEAD/DEAH box helicase [Holophaga sp.]